MDELGRLRRRRDACVARVCQLKPDKLRQCWSLCSKRAMSAIGTWRTIGAAPQNVCFQGQTGRIFTRPIKSANDPKQTCSLWLDGLYSRWMDRENAARQFPDGFYGGRYGRG